MPKQINLNLTLQKPKTKNQKNIKKEIKMNKIEIIDTEIVKGKNSVTRIIIAKYYEHRIKAVVKSDKAPHKNTANLYAFDGNAMSWNNIYSIAPSNMNTPCGISFDNHTKVEDLTQTDIDKLFKMVTQLLD